MIKYSLFNWKVGDSHNPNMLAYMTSNIAFRTIQQRKDSIQLASINGTILLQNVILLNVHAIKEVGKSIMLS